MVAGKALELTQMYSAQLLDHFQNPRNPGDIPEADASAQVENPACGDVLRITLKTSGDQILQAGFKAKGCVSAIACGSVLTELVTGKTLRDAAKLNRDDVTIALGGLPRGSAHAAQLAVEALQAALNRIVR